MDGIVSGLETAGQERTRDCSKGVKGVNHCQHKVNAHIARRSKDQNVSIRLSQWNLERWPMMKRLAWRPSRVTANWTRCKGVRAAGGSSRVAYRGKVGRRLEKLARCQTEQQEVDGANSVRVVDLRIYGMRFFALPRARGAHIPACTYASGTLRLMLTNSAVVVLCAFMAFSCTLPMTASAARLVQMIATPKRVELGQRDK